MDEGVGGKHGAATEVWSDTITIIIINNIIIRHFERIGSL